MTDKSPNLPAYFLSLELENVRCFGPRQTLDLSDGSGRPAQWTLLLGENGVGKTTVLEALTWMRPLAAAGNEVLVYGAPTELNPSLVRGEEWVSVWAKYALGTMERVSEQTHGLFRTKLVARKIHNLMDGRVLGGLFLLAYGATRRMSETGLATNESTSRTATLTDPDARLLNAEELLLRLDYRALQGNRKGTTQQRLEQVSAMLVSLLPDVTDITIEFGGDSGSIRQGLDGSVRFTTPFGKVPLRQLSLGYQTMIAWTVDFASRMFDRYPDSPDPLTEPAVVLIDEVDLHLHPRWQRQILDYLSTRFPRTQFIATAHSPLIVQAATEAGVNLAVLRREGDHVVIDNDPIAVSGWRVDQVLTSDLFTGVDGARGPRTERWLAERRLLLDKSVRTSEEEQRLAVLDQQLEALPTEARPEDQKALDTLHRAAELLAKYSG